MTPKKEAKELVDKFQHQQVEVAIKQGSWYKEHLTHTSLQSSKALALLCVDRIQKLPNIEFSHNKDASQYDYWEEVKREIKTYNYWGKLKTTSI